MGSQNAYGGMLTVHPASPRASEPNAAVLQTADGRSLLALLPIFNLQCYVCIIMNTMYMHVVLVRLEKRPWYSMTVFSAIHYIPAR